MGSESHGEPTYDRVRFTRLPLDSMDDAEGRLLLALWQAKRGGRRAPARAEFDPAELKTLLPRLILVEVRHDPLDFRYRVSGTDIYNIHGLELTGKSVRDLTPADYAQEVWREMTDLIATWEPQFSRLEFISRDGKSRSYTVLRLPLSSDGTTVDRVFVQSMFGPERQRLKEMLQQFRRH